MARALDRFSGTEVRGADSEAELERLKREITVERLAEARGVELKQHGANLIGLCPFHEDHEPSLVVTPAKNLWHCLGACQTGGSGDRLGDEGRGRVASATPSSSCAASLGAVSRQPSTHRRAELARRGRRSTPTTERCSRKVVALLPRDAQGRAPRRWRTSKRAGPRRIAELIERFQLGFANRTLGLPPARQEPQGGARDARAAAGARHPARERPRALQRLAGHPDLRRARPAWSRSTAARSRRRCARARRCTSTCPARTAACGTSRRSQASKEIILCEALIDALTFWCAGFRNVTASYGVEGFTDDHLAAFRRTAPSAC